MSVLLAEPSHYLDAMFQVQRMRWKARNPDVKQWDEE